MKDVGGAVLAGSTPPFLGRERAAVTMNSPIRWSIPMMMMMFITIFAGD